MLCTTFPWHGDVGTTSKRMQVLTHTWHVRRRYLLHPAGPPCCWQMECQELNSSPWCLSHTYRAGCQGRPRRAGSPSCLQPHCNSLLPFLQAPAVCFPCLQWGWAHPGLSISLLVLTRLTLWVLNSCWCRWYQEALNLLTPNFSHSSDGFHLSTSQIQVSCLAGHNWGRTFKWVKVAKSVFKIIGPDSSHLSSSQSVPPRKYKYGVDVKNYYLELPSQKEMYFLHFPHLKTTYLT